LLVVAVVALCAYLTVAVCIERTRVRRAAVAATMFTLGLDDDDEDA